MTNKPIKSYNIDHGKYQIGGKDNVAADYHYDKVDSDNVFMLNGMNREKEPIVQNYREYLCRIGRGSNSADLRRSIDDFRGFVMEIGAEALLAEAKALSARLQKSPLTGGPERKPFPEQAPALWSLDRKPNDTPATFIPEHYGSWIENGLTLPALAKLDNALYVYTRRWLKEGNTLPFDLPSKSELIKREQAETPPEEIAAALREGMRGRMREKRSKQHAR